MTARELKVNRRTILGGIGGTFLAGTTRAWRNHPNCRHRRSSSR